MNAWYRLLGGLMVIFIIACAPVSETPDFPENDSVTLSGCLVPFPPLSEGELENMRKYPRNKTNISVRGLYSLGKFPDICAKSENACDKYICTVRKAINTTDSVLCESLPETLIVNWECRNASEIPSLIKRMYNISPETYELETSACIGDYSRKATGTFHTGEPFIFVRGRTIPGYSGISRFNCLATNTTQFGYYDNAISISKSNGACGYPEFRVRHYKLKNSCHTFVNRSRFLHEWCEKSNNSIENSFCRWYK